MSSLLGTKVDCPGTPGGPGGPGSPGGPGGPLIDSPGTPYEEKILYNLIKEG